jgi:excisionase family DNA binding protein
MTPPQVAEILGVEPEKIRRWIEAGELRATNIVLVPGGRPRYKVSEQELAAFLERRSTTPTPKPARRKRSAGFQRKYYT